MTWDLLSYKLELTLICLSFIDFEFEVFACLKDPKQIPKIQKLL